MCKKVTLFYGDEDYEEENKKAFRMLKKLQKLGIEITRVGDTAKILKGKVVFPYIRTDDKHQYYGLDSIDWFVEDQKLTSHEAR